MVFVHGTLIMQKRSSKLHILGATFFGYLCGTTSLKRGMAQRHDGGFKQIFEKALIAMADASIPDKMLLP